MTRMVLGWLSAAADALQLDADWARPTGRALAIHPIHVMRG